MHASIIKSGNVHSGHQQLLLNGFNQPVWEHKYIAEAVYTQMEAFWANQDHTSALRIFVAFLDTESLHIKKPLLSMLRWLFKHRRNDLPAFIADLKRHPAWMKLSNNLRADVFLLLSNLCIETPEGIEDARKWMIESHSEIALTADIFSGWMEHYCRICNRDGILNTVAIMEAVFDLRPTIQLMKVCITECAKIGQTDMILELLALMNRQGITLDTEACNDFLKTLVKKQPRTDFSVEPISLLLDLFCTDADIQTYELLLTAYHLASKITWQDRALAYTKPSVDPRHAADYCLTLWEDMDARRIKPTLTMFTLSLSIAGPVQVNILMERMRKRGIVMNRSRYEAAIFSAFNHNDGHRALALVSEAKTCGVQLNIKNGLEPLLILLSNSNSESLRREAGKLWVILAEKERHNSSQTDYLNMEARFAYFMSCARQQDFNQMYTVFYPRMAELQHATFARATAQSYFVQHYGGNLPVPLEGTKFHWDAIMVRVRRTRAHEELPLLFVKTLIETLPYFIRYCVHEQRLDWAVAALDGITAKLKVFQGSKELLHVLDSIEKEFPLFDKNAWYARQLQ
jgi:hypothetical protein